MTSPAPRERLLALDAFRGLTIAAMLLVNNPGNWSHIYAPLRHAPWHGWTPTDLIFPFFLFIVGITTHLSLTARRARGDDERALVRQVVTRGLAIIGLGLLLHAFPFFPVTQWTAIRVPGVLQRIGVVYLAGGLLSLRLGVRAQAWTIVALLLGYWGAMTLLPVPGQPGVAGDYLDEPARTLAAWIDRAVLEGHLWRSTRTWDPEGVLSTFPALGTMLLGLLAGRWLGRREVAISARVRGLLAAGVLATALGAIWNRSFPINKSLWTSSYVLFTAGLAMLTLGTILWITDARGVRAWTKPLVTYGLNPMVAFVGSGVMAKLLGGIIYLPHGDGRATIKGIAWDALSSVLPPKIASLTFALLFVLCWYAILLVLERRRIILKV